MPTFLDGILVIDKPGGITSRTAVDRASAWFPRGTTIGHAGTLDPLATGVLVLCVGMATRLIEYIQRMSKLYRAGIFLGAPTDTDDADGTITPTPDASAPARRKDRTGAVGVPRPYRASTARIFRRQGHRPARYDLARQGQEVSLQPRTVTIERIDIESYAYLPGHRGALRQGDLHPLAGPRPGAAARLWGLCREIAADTDWAVHGRGRQHTGHGCSDRTLPCLHPPEAALSELPRVTLAARDAGSLAQGREVRDVTADGVVDGEREVAVFNDAGRLLAVGLLDASRRLLRPVKVL